MCGIAGIVSFSAPPPRYEEVVAMCNTLVHRGPDDQGIDVGHNVVLGTRRLAIIDVEGGRQPFHNENRSVSAVFNGEIYNFRDLRTKLELAGHRFASFSDGEVLVHLWEDLGSSMLERLNGMFAIALHDRNARRLLLARDRLGIKPLFFARTPRHLVFASEIKAILATGLVTPELDPISLQQFLAWEYVPGPRTMFAGIQKLGPGDCLEVDVASGRIVERSWWRLPSARTTSGTTDTAWADKVDAKIEECVRRQLVSDVPLGAFLSGGVDSSLIVHAMGPSHTFSIGFRDPSYDESAWARRVAEHLGVDHHVEFQEPHVDELFGRLMHFMEDPIADFSIFPTYLLSRVARESVTVALAGDGGDELFGGYETVQAQYLAALWQRAAPSLLGRRLLEGGVRRLRPRPTKKGLVNRTRRFVEGLANDPALGHARWRLFASRELQRELLRPATSEGDDVVADHVLRLTAEAGNRGELDRALYVDLRSYLVDNCLVKLDRMSMACSLEARLPLLDHELVELAFEIPERLKVSRMKTKVLLKRVAARHLPRDCVYRPKEGFSIPIKHWLAGHLRPLVDDLLEPRQLSAEGVFDGVVVDRLKQEHFTGENNHSHVLWALMIVQDWRRRWSA
jgi:asparagine synthase (glutamine-hydrolysing)